MEHRITEADLRSHFDARSVAVPSAFHDYLDRADLRYRAPTADEVEEYVLMVLQRTDCAGLRRSADENLAAFEAGWRENLVALQTDGLSDAALRPRYFRDNKFLRYQRRLIVSRNPRLEYDLLVLARYLVFARFLSEVDDIYELGCGSCSNLFQLARMFPSKQLHGWDWTAASMEIANHLCKMHGLRCDGRRFDMLNPPVNLELAPRSAVFTVHAMEQIGRNHGKLTECLLRAMPVIVVQLEPIVELYNSNNVYDKLALRYSRDRGYLAGYLPALQDLERAGKVELLAVHRPYVGGIIHEASLLVWRPR